MERTREGAAVVCYCIAWALSERSKWSEKKLKPIFFKKKLLFPFSTILTTSWWRCRCGWRWNRASWQVSDSYRRCSLAVMTPCDWLVDTTTSLLRHVDLCDASRRSNPSERKNFTTAESLTSMAFTTYAKRTMNEFTFWLNFRWVKPKA